jgi:hypothetical protein
MQADSLFVRLISHQPAVLFSQNKPATNNQPTVLFSHSKSAPAISHQPNEQAVSFLGIFALAVLALKFISINYVLKILPLSHRCLQGTRDKKTPPDEESSLQFSCGAIR